ncbi:MAG: DUF1080 domain-containing protein, partial [Candidatus Eremiobacteraeota bacterium]|nr:DUF1080 domain-containing protein [Candidatus Eremiobacteraeota bacterium]
GSVKVVAQKQAQNALDLSPQSALLPSETHAALATSLASFGDFDASVDVLTVAQLRQPAPNEWEVAWVLWHYADNTHFYYFIPKPNGWELGKEDPAYPDNQRYLATGTTPRFTIGNHYLVRIVQVGSQITVYVDGTTLTTFNDAERPYSAGALGLYCEDSHVQFGAISASAHDLTLTLRQGV